MSTCDGCGREEGEGAGKCYKGRYQDREDRDKCTYLTIVRLEAKVENLEAEVNSLKLYWTYEYRTAIDKTPPEGSSWELFEYSLHYQFWRRPRILGSNP